MLNDRSRLVGRLALLLLLLTLVGTSFPIRAEILTSDDVLTVLQSVQWLAAVDVEAAATVWMEADARQEWGRLTDDELASPSLAAAFFDHMLWLVRVTRDGEAFGALYQPWVGALLVLEIDPVAVTVRNLVLRAVPTEEWPQRDPEGLYRSLVASWTAAAETFDRVVRNWGTESADSVGEESWRGMLDVLDQQLSTLRTIWSAEDGTSSDLRETLVGLLARVAAADVSGLLAPLADESDAWLELLGPTRVTAEGGQAEAILTSAHNPYLLLWVRIDLDAGGQAIDEVRLLDLLAPWTETEGGES